MGFGYGRPERRGFGVQGSLISATQRPAFVEGEEVQLVYFGGRASEEVVVLEVNDTRREVLVEHETGDSEWVPMTNLRPLEG